MNILGISAFYHDAAAALLRDGHLVAAAQEERFSRKKHDASFPSGAIASCLAQAGIATKDLDAVVFYDKPLLKFERLLETYGAFAPRGLFSFVAAMPVWLREKLFLKKILRDGLSALGDYDRKKLRLLFPEHHLSHAASAFYPSPFDESAILTVDGVGEWATASIGHGRGNSIRILKELRFPHSPGLLYSAFTYFLGFRVNGGEYKVMGLAPYGDPSSGNYRRYTAILREQLTRLHDDGSLWLNPKYFTYATGLRMVDDRLWERLFGFARRAPEAAPQQHHADMALAVQLFIEDVLLLMAREARRLTGSGHLCLAGGVALNCVANGRLLREKIFDRLYIQPAAGDAGGAPGAALAAWHIHYGKERTLQTPDAMQGALLGPAYGAEDVAQMLSRTGAVAKRYDDLVRLAADTAALLDAGQIVGWFQGRMEFGPRALGNRSILADARQAGMQDRLNRDIKFREGFRPFAPAVLEEEAGKYFELDVPSPYMLLTAGLKQSLRMTLPDGYAQLGLKEKLAVPRSEFPAITHVDFSARVQTVGSDADPRFRRLLEAFRERTGHGVLVNTSFNVRGEPPVCTPDDAYRCFMKTGMDVLVIGDYVFMKTEQPDFNLNHGDPNS